MPDAKVSLGLVTYWSKLLRFRWVDGVLNAMAPLVRQVVCSSNRVLSHLT